MCSECLCPCGTYQCPRSYCCPSGWVFFYSCQVKVRHSWAADFSKEVSFLLKVRSRLRHTQKRHTGKASQVLKGIKENPARLGHMPSVLWRMLLRLKKWSLKLVNGENENAFVTIIPYSCKWIMEHFFFFSFFLAPHGAYFTLCRPLLEGVKLG